MRGITELSIPQLIFINSYLEHRDFRRAVIDSGFFDGVDHDVKTVEKIGLEWLEDPIVKGEIDRRLRVQAMAVAVTQSEILDELRKVAFFDPRNLFHGDGKMKTIHEMDNEEAAALAHLEFVSITDGGVVTKIVPASKMKALELLGKHKQMFVDRVEHSSKGKSMFSMAWIDGTSESEPEEEGKDE